MSGTITSANAILLVSPRVANLFPAGPFRVQQFASDDAFATEPVDSAEAIMGVDGHMAVGLTPYIVKQQITLMADSDSISLFELLIAAQNTLKDVTLVDAVLDLPGPGKSYLFTKGALTRLTPFTPGKKVLGPMAFEFSWQSVIAQPLVS